MTIIKSIKTALDIVDCFTLDSPEIGVTEISKKLGLSKSTVSRILKTLEWGSWVTRVSTNQKYRLGSRVLTLAGIFQSNNDWRTIAICHLKELRDLTDELVTVFVIDGDQRLCVEKLDSSHEVRQFLNVGGRYALHAGSAGKLLLAYLPEEERKRILTRTGLPRISANTITDLTILEKELAGIRGQGYAFSHQERATSISSISAPIRDFKGEVIAALCVSGLDARFAGERLEEFIRLTMMFAERISRGLGWSETKRTAGTARPLPEAEKNTIDIGRRP